MDELATALSAVIRNEISRQLDEREPAPPTDPSSGLLGVPEASARLGVRPKTLYEWRRLRKGPPSIAVGRLVKYRAAELDAWLAGSRA